MTAYRAIVLEHFRRPRNRAPLPDANRMAEGVNPLCGDRIRIQLRVDGTKIAEARFTADACALCIASASVLTEHARDMDLGAIAMLDAPWIAASLGGDPPPGRERCALLPLDTFRRAIRNADPEPVIVGLLLAAGGATRFGSQKLVAPFRGIPLVRHAARLLRDTTNRVIAVIGNDAPTVREALAGTGVEIVENAEWRGGLSTSLRRGVESVPADADAVVVTLGDQPEIGPEVIRSLIARWRETTLPIVTARYRGERAPPALLARSVFLEVATLRGDVGAKPLMDAMPDRVAYVDIDAAIPCDVDTLADLAAIQTLST